MLAPITPEEAQQQRLQVDEQIAPFIADVNALLAACSFPVSIPVERFGRDPETQHRVADIFRHSRWNVTVGGSPAEGWRYVVRPPASDAPS